MLLSPICGASRININLGFYMFAPANCNVTADAKVCVRAGVCADDADGKLICIAESASVGLRLRQKQMAVPDFV